MRLQQLEAQGAAAEQLKHMLSGTPDVHSIEVVAALKVTAATWVFATRINGDDVIVKRFLSGDPAGTVTATKAELDHLQTVFGTSDCQANRCLFGWPDDGVIGLSLAPGPRLHKVLTVAEGPHRAALIGHSSRWLTRCSEGRRAQASFAPKFWLKRLEQKQPRIAPRDADRAMIKALLQSLTTQAASLARHSVTRGATHGDFVPINLHYDGETLYGVDIQGQSNLPMAKDTARFLVWSQIRNALQDGPRHHGIFQSDLSAFQDHSPLGPLEWKEILPFFIGFELFMRFMDVLHKAKVRDDCARAIAAYLADAPQR